MSIREDADHFFSGIRRLYHSRPSAVSEEFRQRAVYDRLVKRAKAMYYGNSYAERYAPGADTSRLRDDWSTSIKTVTSLMADEWKTLVARSEYLVRTDPYGRNARKVLLDHIVGSGLRPFPAVKLKNGSPANRINEQLAAGWDRFNDEGIRSGTNRMTVYEAQRLALSTTIDTGGVLTSIVGGRNNAWLPFGLQLLKPTRLDWAKDNYTDDGRKVADVKIVHGIEVDGFGEPRGFWLEDKRDRVSADLMAIHFHQEECEQYMGLPWMTPVLPFAWDLQNILADRLVGSRMVERIALWVKKTSKKTLMQTADSDDNTIPWEPGMVMATDDKPELIQSADRISDTFGALVKLYLHGIASGLGFSYTLLTRDLSDVNFASTRYCSIKDKRFFQSLYQWYAKSGWCNWVWQQYVNWAILSGRIAGLSYSDYVSDKWRFNQVYYLPEGEAWVDPLKDAQALKVQYENGWITLQEICQQRGVDWRAIVTQRKVEDSELRSQGLEYLLPEFESIMMAEEQADNEQETSDQEINK